MQDCKNESELQHMQYDLLTDRSRNQTCHSCEILTFLASLCLFDLCFFASITFGNSVFQFQDYKVSLKRAPGHNYENTILQPGEHKIGRRFVQVQLQPSPARDTL